MAHVADHLSVAELEGRYEACEDVTSSRHFQTIWLLAKGHTVGKVAAVTSFGQRWIEQLLEPWQTSMTPSSRTFRTCWAQATASQFLRGARVIVVS